LISRNSEDLDVLQLESMFIIHFKREK